METKTKAKATTKKTTVSKSKKKTVSFEDIQKRAFEIYLNNGGSASAEQNWIQAETELSK